MDANLVRVRSALQRFEGAVQQTDTFNEDLAAEYNRLRRALALSFGAMSHAAVPRSEFRLHDVKKAIVEEMYALFAGRVDSSLFQIRRYTTPHPDIYAVLASRLGEYVPGWRIRLLSNDALHTERRTRELRDLGLSVSARDDEDGNAYQLDSLEIDRRYGAAFQLRENASKARTLNPRDRAAVISLAEQTADLPERKPKGE